MKLKKAISEHEAVVTRLREWADSPGGAPVSTTEVEQLVRRQHVLAKEINRSVRSLADDDRAIHQAQRIIGATSELFDTRWNELKSRLQQVQRLLVPTFWTQCEIFYRNQRVLAYEHSYKKSRDAIMGWAIDLAPVLQKSSQNLLPLEGKTIQCRDGFVTLSLQKIGAK